MKLVSQRKPARVCGIGVEFGEDFIHPSELGPQHALDLIVFEPGKNFFDPTRELDLNLQCRRIIRIPVRVPEPCEQLMLDVPWRPQTVELESARLDHTVAQIDKALLPVDALPVLERADISVPLSILNFLQLFDDVVGAFFESLVAGGRPHQAYRRKIMSRDMSR